MNSAEKEHLYTTHRNVVRPSKASNFYGFRVALAKTLPVKPPSEPESSDYGDETSESLSKP